VGIAAAVAAWTYDAGRRYAGFDQSEVQGELTVTKRDLAAAQTELERLRAISRRTLVGVASSFENHPVQPVV